jgi:hypothetical protein
MDRQGRRNDQGLDAEGSLMLEGPGHQQRAARLHRAFRQSSRRFRSRESFRGIGQRLRDLGLVGLGCAIGAGGMMFADNIPVGESASTARYVYYANCRDAFLDGAVSIRRGEPGYRSKLDADNDGVACEHYYGT